MCTVTVTVTGLDYIKSNSCPLS